MTAVLIAVCLASLIFGWLVGFSCAGEERHTTIRQAAYYKDALAEAERGRDDYHQQLLTIALGIGLTDTEDSDVCVLLAINRLNQRVAAAEAERDGALDTLAFIDRTYADEHDDNLTNDAKDVKARARVVRRIEEAEKASEARRQEVVHLQRALATRNGEVTKLRAERDAVLVRPMRGVGDDEGHRRHEFLWRWLLHKLGMDPTCQEFGGIVGHLDNVLAEAKAWRDAQSAALRPSPPEEMEGPAG